MTTDLESSPKKMQLSKVAFLLRKSVVRCMILHGETLIRKECTGSLQIEASTIHIHKY